MVSSYIIVNTFSILVAQRSRELALLRALGASKRQVIRSVQLEAFVVGVVGSTLGLGLGFVLALGIRSLVATFGLDLADQPLILAPRTVGRGVRHRDPGHDDRGLAAGPPDRPDRAGPGASRRRGPARVVRTPAPAAGDRADRARHPTGADRPLRRRGPAQRVVGRRRRPGRAAGCDRGQPGDRAAVPAGDRGGRREALRADRTARRRRTRCATRGVRPPPRRR